MTPGLERVGAATVAAPGRRARAALHAALGVALVIACGIAPLGRTRATTAEPAAFRHQATITLEQPGTFVRLPLPVSAYARSRQPALADLRIVDARGARVPFALLAPRGAALKPEETLRPAALYPLPALKSGETEPASPLELEVVGDRITVRRLGAPATSARPAPSARSQTSSPAGAAAAAAVGPAPGWLFDLGERARDEAPPSSLRLSWPAAAEFSAGFELELSDDLRQWRAAGGGQLLALSGAAGRLTQPNVMLPAGSEARFVRLRWLDAARAPMLNGAEQVRVSTARAMVLDAPTAIAVEPGAEPATTGTGLTTTPAGLPTGHERALHYDLGAVLPLVELDLALPATHSVAPVRVQGRNRTDEPWRDLAQTVFYRLQRGTTVDRPPPLHLRAEVRYLRLLPDPRSGPLPATPLAVQAQLASLVFTAQGQAPFRLLAGSDSKATSALPIATLVPALDEERPRMGRAALGPWAENEAQAREEAWRQHWTTWRPALLWAVLLLGVAGLGGMVWRLARKS